MQVRKTYKYRLYHHRRNKRLHRCLDIAGLIWNHMVALQRRYYRLTGGYINRYRMQSHLARLRKRAQGFAHWQLVGGQAMRNWPSDTISPTSASLPTSGEKDRVTAGRASRRSGSTRASRSSRPEGNQYHSREFLKAELNEIACLHRELTRKRKGSNNRRKARRRLARAHERIANKRRNAHWRLAHHLCARYDRICLETLNLEGMKRLWGRKVSDLGFAEFAGILHQVAARTGSEIVQVERWLPTSKSCAACGALQEIPLSVRHFDYPGCGRARVTRTPH